jgi:hypothetical protein
MMNECDMCHEQNNVLYFTTGLEGEDLLVCTKCKEWLDKQEPID